MTDGGTGTNFAKAAKFEPVPGLRRSQKRGRNSSSGIEPQAAVMPHRVYYFADRVADVRGCFQIHVMAAVNDDLFAIGWQQNELRLALSALLLQLRGGEV